MRAVVFEGPGVLAVKEVPTPALEPGTALVRVEAVGICGSDLHGYTGETGRRVAGMIMGHEAGGRLHDTTDGDADIASDATVTFNPLVACGQCPECSSGQDNLCADRTIVGVTPGVPGAYAEFVRVPMANVLPLGALVSSYEAALVEPLAVGLHAASLGIRPETSRVVVLGGGTIGVACALAATRSGVEVIVSEPLSRRRALLEDLGYLAVDPAATDLPEAVMDWTSGTGVSVVVDAVGTDTTTAAALRLCRAGGSVVVVGMNQPTVNNSLYDLVTWERRLIGSFCYTKEQFIEAAEWVASQSPHLMKLVERTVRLDEIDQAFTALSDGSADDLKVLVVP